MEENLGTIYIVTNKNNGKKYVGKTTQPLKDRKRKHFTHYKKFYFQRALGKYNKEDFIWEEKKYPIEELEKWEMYWIKELNTKFPNGYNLTEGGEGIIGYNHTNENKKIIAKCALGNESAKNRINKEVILFISPTGQEYRVENNFNDFCKDHGLPKRTVSAHLNGKRSQELLNGWRINKLDKDGNPIPTIIKTDNTWCTYLLIDPQGKEHIISRGIDQFCKDNNLWYPILLNHANGLFKHPKYNGWEIYKLDENGNRIPKPKVDKSLEFTYHITDPEGKVYEFKQGFNKFCNDHNLSIRSFTQSMTDNRAYKGWIGKKIYV